MLKSIIMSMINVMAHLTSDYFFLQNKNCMCLYSIKNHWVNDTDLKDMR